MHDHDPLPASLEVRMEQLRRWMPDLDDYELDEVTATATARRDVAAAHDRQALAGYWHAVAVMGAEHRAERAAALAALADLTPGVEVHPEDPET